MTTSESVWQTEAAEIALLFRLGRNVEAALQLTGYLERLVAECHHLLVNDTNRQFQSLLASILSCQEKQDWLGLADYLEYELPQYLHALSLT